MPLQRANNGMIAHDERHYRHNRLMRHVARYHFRSTCDIYNGVESADTFGEIHTTYTDLDETHTNIKCYIEPAKSATSGENVREAFTLVSNMFNVVLAGYYPNITRLQGAMIDGVMHNIRDIATDDGNTLTVLAVELYSV